MNILTKTVASVSIVTTHASELPMHQADLSVVGPVGIILVIAMILTLWLTLFHDSPKHRK